MTHEVRIRQAKTSIQVAPGTTVLEAAQAAGISYPHGCRSGRCGMCKSRLLSGSVDYGNHTKFALPPEQKEQGLFLACRATPLEACDIAWLGEELPVDHPVQQLACRVIHLEELTHDIKLVRLALPEGASFVFSPGQFARVSFEGCPSRDYSMANLPGGREIEFHIRHVPGGATSRYVAERLALGDTVNVEGPFGTSYLRETHTGPILAIAGGSGLAPIKAIIDGALATGMRQPIHLFFGARDERDVYLEEYFQDLASRHSNLSFEAVLSAPSGPTARTVGLVTDVALAGKDNIKGWKTYLAGPPVMVEAATAKLEELGVRPEDIHADAFYTQAELNSSVPA